ncbi:MAG TPA: type I methionyl aminopeptidase [Syntrophorhabdaceae bacterium]|nr:type I methionyl aminopeptidase [Syntrophorhabdaceae bacterium]HOL05882.1 type I methionyl aminopeptidase [Syntrophorhabdaceae bacterium]HON84651.1 type I methionyl aminopeptidase [Syntrophorhabdaceae bacterium]HOT42149.1 type I methionyl aminopeptidase [Syntrophorhabdaceae bacterium]HPC67311.1 type I methionyl aminopeptidase [Syntrophorhabdaceae bacterium]
MIIIKTPSEIEKIRVASIYAMEMLLYLKDNIKAGIRTIELEMLCEQKIKSDKKIKAAFKGYNGYPFCLCVSVNDEVVHGMPGNRILKEGDIVSLDFGARYDGFYGDAALTEAVGSISDETKRLLKITEESLYKGIEQTREGNRLNDISNAIQTHAESAGFSVVREFVGHGIGASLHEEPQVPNYGEKGRGIRLKRGMVFAIEPMINMGRSEVMIKENGWTAVTKDGSLSAHFEHTVAITDKGPEILSKI